MIKLFEDHYEAKEYACAYLEKHGGNELMPIVGSGHCVWAADDQILVFPVVLIRAMPTIACFDLFSADLRLRDESLGRLRRFLTRLVGRLPDVRIITIAERVIELQLPKNNNGLLPEMVNEIARLNEDLSSLSAEDLGKLPVVQPQPSAFHVSNNLVKIGLYS